MVPASVKHGGELEALRVGMKKILLTKYHIFIDKGSFQK